MMLKNFLFRFKKKIYPYYKGLTSFLSFKDSKIQIFVPKYDVFDEEDINLASRIFASFKKSELLSINKNNLASSEIYEEQIPHKAYYDLPDRDHIDQITQHIRRNLSLKT